MFLHLYQPFNEYHKNNNYESLLKIIIFSNLISLCAIFLLCKYIKEFVNCFIIFLHCIYENFWLFCCFNAWDKDIPGRYYIIILRWLLDYTTSRIFTIFGWFIVCRIFIYLFIVTLGNTIHRVNNGDGNDSN